MSITDPKSRNDIATIPNAITLAGIIFVFAYLIAFLMNANRWIIFSCIFMAGLSDLLDGFFARKFDQGTYLGEILDPFRDRMLLLAILLHVILVSGFNKLVIGIIFFEVFVVLAKILSMVRKTALEVHWVGKLRQLIHVTCGGLIIMKFYFHDFNRRFFPDINDISINKVLWVMFVASAVSMAVYGLYQINDIRDKDLHHNKDNNRHPR